MFYDRFKQLCEAKGISIYKAATEIGLNRAAANKWKSGSIPNGQTLIKLADYLGVTNDYLLGKENEPAENGKHSVTDDDMMFALWGNTADMDKDDLDDVKRYAAFVREKKHQN